MNVITEWMDGWGVLIEVKSKRNYTVSLYEEVTPLPKSQDSSDAIMLDGTLSVFWPWDEINVVHNYANNSFMLYYVHSYKACMFWVRLQLQ